MSYNKLILKGHLTRDPELRVTPAGLSVMNCGIAVNRKYKDKEEVCFIDIQAFGATADNICKYFHKGSEIFVDGRLKMDQWDDKATGQKRSKHIMVVDSFDFCGSKDGDGNTSAPPPRSPPPPASKQHQQEDASTYDDDDVPF